MKNLLTYELFEAKLEGHAIKFHKWNCVLDFNYYNNNRTAIQLIDANDGQPIAVATVNIPDEKIKKDEVIIKDYSENEGMLDTLVKAGIVSKPIRMVKTGFSEVAVCKLLVNK